MQGLGNSPPPLAPPASPKEVSELIRECLSKFLDVLRSSGAVTVEKQVEGLGGGGFRV